MKECLSYGKFREAWGLRKRGMLGVSFHFISYQENQENLLHFNHFILMAPPLIGGIFTQQIPHCIQL